MYPIIPFISPFALRFTSLQISLYVAGRLSLQVRSTTDTSSVGTLSDIPVNFPIKDGITFPTALAAPVVEGIIFPEAARPALQSFPPLQGPSQVI